MTGIVASNPPQESLIKSEEKDDENRPTAPSATPAASRGTEQPRPGATVCQNCLTTTTPLWRRDENGQILCNACGLFFKLHGRRRPISLKTDVIKSRNRSRNTSLGRRQHPAKRVRVGNPRADSPDKRRSVSAERPYTVPLVARPSGSPTGTPTTQQVAAQPTGAQAPGVPAGADAVAGSAPRSAVAPSTTPSTAPAAVPPPVAPATNIPPPVQAPSSSISPHASTSTASPSLKPLLFALDSQATPIRTPNSSFVHPMNSPALDPQHSQPVAPPVQHQGPPNIQLVRGSMSELLMPRSPPEGLERVPPLRHIKASELREQQQNMQTLPSIQTPASPAAPAPPRTTEEINKELGTRVSELELVNDLLKRRIADLEYSESQARRTAIDAQQTVEALWKQVTALKEKK